MKVYDFDNTIYNGESVVDFFLFILNKEKKLFVFLPMVSYIAILYKTGKLDIEQVYKLANTYSDTVIKYQDVANKYIEEFWKENIHKLKKDFLNIYNLVLVHILALLHILYILQIVWEDPYIKILGKLPF